MYLDSDLTIVEPTFRYNFTTYRIKGILLFEGAHKRKEI